MSLKAKLEAVIYAAEEPVTLGQLAALFAADALEWKAAQDAAAREQTAEVAASVISPTDPMPLLAQGLEYLGLADTPAVYAESASIPDQAAPENTPDHPLPETGETGEVPGEPGEIPSEALPEPATTGDLELTPNPAAESDNGSGAAPEVVDIEAEARRLARQRDREVKAILKHLLDELVAASASDGRGVEIREIAGGYRMATKPECHDAVRMFVKSLKPVMKLSLPALETLAVVAYKQPVTAPEVNEIRGVESAGVLGSLLARKLIATAGRKQVIGRPILYKTTKEFLMRFGLKDVNELPSMEEFEKMAEIELDEQSGDEATTASQTAFPAGAASEGEELLANVEENDEAVLESNSPDGEELAGTAEIASRTAEKTETAAQPGPADDSAMLENDDAADEAMGDPAELSAEEHASQPEHAPREHAPQPVGPEPEQAEDEASRDDQESQKER